MPDEVGKIYQVKATANARYAILESAQFIANEQRSAWNASKWLDQIWSAVDALEYLPRRYPIADGYDYAVYVVRRAIVGSHLLLFTVDVDEQLVYVVGLRHGSRMPRFTDLSSRPEDDDPL